MRLLLMTGVQVVVLLPSLLFLFVECPGPFVAVARTVALADLAALLPDHHTAFWVVKEPAGSTLEKQCLEWKELVWVTSNGSTWKAAEHCGGL